MANFYSAGTRRLSTANWILSTVSTSPSDECITIDYLMALDTVDSEDPWYWDIDRVVIELCTESQSWTSDTARSRRRPNFTTLEAALREQEIDGSTLLTAVDDAVLKNELGIKVLGQLAPVKQIIWDLRQESTCYRNWLGRHGSDISLASHLPYNFSSAPNVRKRSGSTVLRETDVPANLCVSPAREHLSGNVLGSTGKIDMLGEQGLESDDTLQLDAWVADATGSKRRRLGTEVTPTISCLEDHNCVRNDHEVGLVPCQPDSENGRPQVGNDTVTDIAIDEELLIPETQVPKKQRKRIAPTLVTSEIDVGRHRELPTEADTVINHDPQNIEPGIIYVGDDGKKRLIPISQSGPDIDLPRRHQEYLRKQALIDGSGLKEERTQGLEAAEQILKIARQDEGVVPAESLSTGYLGKAKFPVNDIFYSGTGIGKDLPSVEEENGDLQLYSQGAVSDGRRLYVHGLMKRFLCSGHQIIHKDGERYAAQRPYPTRLAPMHQSPSFTLLHKDADGEVHATRESLSLWPELGSGAPSNVGGFQDYDDRQAHFDLPDNLHLGGPNTYDNWDTAFLEKYRYIDGGDDVLPLYGDSDEEGEYDRETWKEIEEEHGTLEKPLLPLRMTPLTEIEVNAAIDEGIAQIVVVWHEKKLPKLQRHAWSLWKRSRKKSRLREIIRKASEHVDRLNNERLPQMRQEFLLDRWVSKKQVLRVTKVMELTVFDREDLLWQLSVVKSKHEPEKPPPRVPKPVTSTSPAFKDDNDGESIITDTETQDSMDEDGFIDDDAESADEVEHSRADDEADDFSASDEANCDRSLDSEHRAKANSGSLKKSLYKNFAMEIGHGSDDKLMPGISTNASNDEEIGRPHTELSLSPQLPLRPTPGDRGAPQANKSTVLNKKANPSQEPTQEIIDLTILSSDTSMGENSSGGSQTVNLITPEKRNNKLRLSFKRETIHTNESSDVMEVSQSEANDIPVNYLTLTDPAAIAKIPRRKWEEAGDRGRLLIGELFRIMPGRKEELSELFSQLTLTQMWSRMVDVMHAFRNGKDRVQGIDSKTYRGLTGVMRLFETYAVGRSRRSRENLEPAEIEMILEKEKLFPHFHRICRKTFDRLLTKAKEYSDDEDDEPLPAIRRGSNVSSGSTSESDELEQDAPHKTRRKLVFENAQARDLRQQDQQRLVEQEERRRILQDKLARTGFSVTAGQRPIIINDAKHDDQGFVYVHEQISRRIKEHQIDGVRFMWSQIVTNGVAMQGCLLAHTMGLGKTMQVITLLVAIAEAAKSPDPSISSQIPPSLRESKTLVLCPPGLIDNWMDELLMWAPQGVLGEYRKFDSSVRAKDFRLDIIENWYNNGGILIMSYDMFRKLVHNNSTQKKAASLNDEEHAQVREHLLQGPNIIVADEAHKMKNANASVTQAALQFRSSSRIALTGSPLANNVVEYHTMIEWIAPNYLGPITEFRAKYVEPIQQGSYFESTPYERRKSLKMLSILRKDLEPKVHRADISVLRRDLKPKTEFVITVPLTKLQHTAYSIYVKSMLNNDHEVTKDGQVQLSTLWHWLAILSLLCNHPACFKAKLSERKDDAEKKIRRKPRPGHATHKALTTSEDDDVPNDVPVWKVGVSEELVRQEMDLFKKFGSAVEESYSSNKVKLLLQILDASKAVDDKVLVFSQSIQTLDFLERLCRSTGRKYARLDGSTKMSSRQGLTKDFNTGDTELYLISTTAGGIGLNLPGANRVIIFDFKFNPVNEEQAIGRAYRIGQQKPVFVYRLVAGGTFEEIIHNTAVFKMQLASKVVDKKNPVAWAKKRTGEFLFEPKVVKQQDLTSFKGVDPIVLNKILDSQGQDSTIRAIVMTDTFERHDHEELTAEEQQEVLREVNDEKLKRLNKPAWDALIQKRALAARPQHAGLYQVMQKHVQRVTGSISALERPPILPGAQPVSTAQTHSPRIPSKHSGPRPKTPDMAPIAGVNTKIRDSSHPPDKRNPREGTASISASSRSQKLVVGHTDDATNRLASTRRIPWSRPSNSLTRRPAHDTPSAKDHSTHQSKLNPPGNSWAPDHKRSLSGDQEGSDGADRLLRVGIRQYSQSGNSNSAPNNKNAEKILDDLAVSIRKEIERTDPTKLKECVERIIGLFSADRELADSLVSGKVTAGAVIAMSFIKPGNKTDATNGTHPSRVVGIGHAPLDREQKLGYKISAAIQDTLSQVLGFSNSRQSIAVASMGLVKALVDMSKDREAFEAASDAMLIEVSNHQTCVELVNGAIQPRELLENLIARSAITRSTAKGGTSDSPKSSHLSNDSNDSTTNTYRSPQSNAKPSSVAAIQNRSRLPRWAVSSIERANLGNYGGRPSLDNTRQASPRESSAT